MKHFVIKMYIFKILLYFSKYLATYHIVLCARYIIQLKKCSYLVFVFSRPCCRPPVVSTDVVLKGEENKVKDTETF